MAFIREFQGSPVVLMRVISIILLNRRFFWSNLLNSTVKLPKTCQFLFLSNAVLNSNCYVENQPQISVSSQFHIVQVHIYDPHHTKGEPLELSL